MTIVSEKERVLIWGKTYPELSTRYAETVCTAGVRQDGRPIRLYPVPLRYLDTQRQYALWDWVDVQISKAADDSRPESYKVRTDSIAPAGHIDPDDSEWAERRAMIFRDPSWHFSDVGALKEAERASGRSLGLVRPGSIERVYAQRKPADAEREYEEKMNQIQAQRDLFLPEYKTLAFRRYDIKLQWRCEQRCPECTNGPHDMQVLDWGLIELARKNGWDWDSACDRLRTICDQRAYDFRLFLGNMKAHPTAFTIVGLWYPKLRAQLALI